MVPKSGERWTWKGKLRVISKYVPATNWVYFVDGTSAKLSKNMKKGE